MIIDTHCHLSSEGLAKAISRYTPHKLLIDKEMGILSTALSEKIPIVNEQDRIDEMDKLSINANVISVGTYTLFSEKQLFASAQTRLNISQVVNDYLANICQKFPGRFMAFADIPLSFGDIAIKEMIRSVDELHLNGLGLVTSYRGKYLDSSEFSTFFQEVNRRQLTIFVHPFNPSGVNKRLLELDMYRVVGFPCETALTFCRMSYSRFIEKYPNITFILSHAGGIIPFIWQRINSAYHGNLREPPTNYLKKYYYDTALSDTKSLMLTYERVGDHLIFGTDYPFKKDHITRTLTAIDNMNISTEVRAKILGGNAIHLLNNK